MRHANSYDALRLTGAVSVFWSHQLGASGFAEPTVPLLGTTAGGFGVALFFSISGYLVTKSLMSRRSVKSYLWSRCLRIYPGLIACLILTVLAGAMATRLPATAYFADPQTWSFIWRNLLSIFVDRQFTLPGVLEDARWPAVNTPLWTIAYETAGYLLIAILFLIGSPSGFKARVAVASTAALILYVVIYATVPWPEDRSIWFTRLEPHFAVRFAVPFLTGAAVAALAAERYALAAAGLLAISAAMLAGTVAYEACAWAVTALLVNSIGNSKILAWYSTAPVIRRFGDLSYGIYLYAYPVQNYLITRYYDGSNFAAVAAVSFLSIVALAALSWRLVEKPSLQMRERIRADGTAAQLV
ncbi:MAG: hypothetical protein DI537_08385 [Stutzerimonas stutzeri]|nr:MAG: hypothetical protein DI537_08385 [Stutzerimonas stutzeri]